MRLENTPSANSPALQFNPSHRQSGDQADLFDGKMPPALSRDTLSLRFGKAKSKDDAAAKEAQLTDGELYDKLPRIVQTWIERGAGVPLKNPEAEARIPVIYPEHVLAGMMAMSKEAIEKLDGVEDPDRSPTGDQRLVLTYRTLLEAIRPQDFDSEMIPEPARLWELLEDSQQKIQDTLKDPKRGAKKKELQFSPALRTVIQKFNARGKYFFTTGDEFFHYLLKESEKVNEKPKSQKKELSYLTFLLDMIRDQYEQIFLTASEREEYGLDDDDVIGRVGSSKSEGKGKTQGKDESDDFLSPNERRLKQWRTQLKDFQALPPAKRVMTPEQAAQIEELVNRYAEWMPKNSGFGGGEESSELRNVQDRLKVIFSLPWEKSETAPIDLKKVESLLSQNHYGLEKPKESILEFMSVARRKAKLIKAGKLSDKQGANQGGGKILCLVGPKGTGKSTIAKVIARGTSRKFVKLSLNGVTDVSKLKGDRAVYVGASVGDFFKAMIEAKTPDPVILLDEFDKMQHVPHHGDPRQALLDLLDPEQNQGVTDDYVGIPYDFSRALFILTANDISELPAPLLDRLEIIQLRGYSDDEKVEIATRHLVPKRLQANGLTRKEISLPKQTLRHLVQHYTPEGGVRELERKIDMICRKVVDRLERKPAGQKKLPKAITPDLVKSLLGPAPQFEKIKESRVGRVNGLYYSEGGGGLLGILVRKQPLPIQSEKGGTQPGELKMVSPTGNLEKVMNESFQTAFGYIASNLDVLSAKLGTSLVPDNTEVRLIPGAEEGGITKDGTSAGAAIALAMVSRLVDRKVRGDLAMTGTITYDGDIGAIGGLMEKITGAARGGAKIILVPAENYDTDTQSVIEYNGAEVPIPKDVAKKVRIVPVNRFEQVLDLALEKP